MALITSDCAPFRDEYHNNRTVGGDMPSFCVDITYFDSLAPPTVPGGDGTCSFCHPCPFPDSNGIFWGRHANYPNNPLRDGSIVKIPMRDECVMLTEDNVEEIITVGRMTDCEMSDCGIVCDAKDGTYIVQWTAIKAKEFMVEVAREQSREPGGGVAVPNSPFSTRVVAGDTSVFGCVSVGDGRFAGTAGAPAVIDIKTADLYGNKKTYGGDRFPWLLERISNGVKFYANSPGFQETDYAKSHDATDNDDGTYQFIYYATVAATYTLDVRLIAELYPEPGEFIVDSPWFNVKIHPAPASALHSEATGEELTRAFAGYQSAFTIKSFDRYKNERTVGGDDFRSSLQGPVNLDCYVADLSYGEYIVAYQADVSGAYNLSVTLTQGGRTEHIRGSMFDLRLVPEKPRVVGLYPRSGPVTGDTLMSFQLEFVCPGAMGCEPTGGPRSQDDFVGWLNHLQTRNITLKFTAWDGMDEDDDAQVGEHHEWEIQGRYDDDSGEVKCRSRDFYRDIYELGKVPHPGETSYSTVELKAESMEYTDSATQFYYYAIPVRVTYFSPHTGPDSGFTAVSVEGMNMVQNDVTDNEVRCKFGDQVGPQATFVPGTGILLCLSGDYRPIAQATCDAGAHWGHADACPKVVQVPLTVALNGQQFTEPELLFDFYRSPVEVYKFAPLSGPITGSTSTLIFGLNFVDTGIIRCKWGDDESAIAPAHYVDVTEDAAGNPMQGGIRCDSPRVDRLETPYSPGYFRLEVALNGAQFSVTPVMGQPAPDFFFYNRPHVGSVLPDFGAYFGGTGVALTALPGALFVSPSAVSEISCMFKTGRTILEVPGHFDGMTGEVQCVSPPTLEAMTVRVEVALNGQQYTQDLVKFAYTPVLSGLDINLGPTSGGTIIHVSGSGFIKQSADEMMCRFTDVSGAVEDLFQPVAVFIDNRTVICVAPAYDLVEPYPYMYPAAIEISLDACLACRFGNHYSQSAALTTFSFYEDPQVKTLGFEPYNSGLMDGGQDLEIAGQFMVTIAEPMPPMFCAFLGDGIHTATMVIIEATVDVAAETVFCTVPTVDVPQDVAVELSLNSQQYTQSAVSFNYYDPTRAPEITNMRPKSGPKEGGTLVTFFGENMANVRNIDCRFNNITSGNVHPAVTSYLIDYMPEFDTAWAMFCTTAKNFHVDPMMPGYNDEREDAGPSTIDITNGDLGHGELWSNELNYEFTETFAPLCSAYLPIYDPWSTEFWTTSPQEMGAGYMLDVVAGIPSDFRIKGRDKFGDDRPYGADFFYIDLQQICESQEPGHLCRWEDAEPVYFWRESIDLDMRFNPTLAPELETPGEYIVGLTFTISGDYRMRISLADVDIKASPWDVYVSYGPIAPAVCRIYGPGLGRTTAGQPSYFNIQARDGYGNNRTTPANCAPGSADALDREKCHDFKVHAEVDSEAESQRFNQPVVLNSFDGVVEYGESGLGSVGIYLVNFETTKAGEYNISVTLDMLDVNGSHVMASPALVIIAPDVTETTESTVDGEGPEHNGRDVYRAGDPGMVTVVGRDMYGNARLVGGDQFNVTMHGEEHAEWYISYLNGELELEQCGPAPGVAGGVACVDREIGINYVNGSIVDNADSSYTVTYNLTVAGVFRMDALRAGMHIKGSPYITTVEPAVTHAPTCTAVGNGITGGVAGDSFYVNVQSKDVFYNDQTRPGDNFTVVLQGVEWYNSHVTRVVQTNFTEGGVYAGTYFNTISGIYSLSITGGDDGRDHILGSPFAVLVEPDITVPWNSIAFGNGIEEGLAGDFASFEVQPRDQYGNNRTTLDSVDFQISLEPVTALPLFWVEKAGILDPTDVVVTPTEYKERGYFDVGLMIYPQGLYLVGVVMNGYDIMGSPFSVMRQPRPAPIIERVQFYDSLVRLMVIFDQNTNRARMGKGSPCTVIFRDEFVNKLGEGAGCDWRDDKELTISLGYQATVTSDGDLAVLREYDFDFSQYLGGIQANLENSIPANGTQPVLISADPPTPVAVIVGPTTIGYCDAALISAELSYGGGPRALQFKWKAEDHEGDLLSSRVPPIALSTFLSITVYGSETPYMFEFGKFDLRPNQHYTFSLLAQNFLGLRDRTEWVLSKADVPLPTILIEGSAVMKTTRSAVIRLNGDAELAICLAQNPLDFEWFVMPSVPSGHLIDPDSYIKTRYSRSLYIPKDLLMVGENYTLRLWGAYRPGFIEGMGHDYNNTGEVIFMVGPGNLTARIGGGDRVVSTQAAMVLDGGQSEDADQSAEDMRYLWTCRMEDNSPCYDHRNATLVAMGQMPTMDDQDDSGMLPTIPSRDAILTVDRDVLYDYSDDTSGTWYIWTLQVIKYIPQTRSATASVRLLAINISLPDVAIAPQAKRKQNANTRLILESVVGDWTLGELEPCADGEPGPCLRWMVVQGDVSLDQLRVEDKLATTRFAENLVFRNNVLSIGGFYKFRLTSTFSFVLNPVRHSLPLTLHCTSTAFPPPVHCLSTACPMPVHCPSHRPSADRPPPFQDENGDGDVLAIMSYAELDVRVNSPPCAGAFFVHCDNNPVCNPCSTSLSTVQCPEGVGLVTDFVFTASLWADDPVGGTQPKKCCAGAVGSVDHLLIAPPSPPQEDMPLLYRFGYTKLGAATVLGDYTDKNVMMAKVPFGSSNYTASDYDLTMFVNETANLANDEVENPPLLVLQVSHGLQLQSPWIIPNAAVS